MKGACQIIAVKGQKIRADPHLIGKAQALASPHLMEQLTEKGHILVIHIGKQKASVPERIYSIDHKQRQHNRCRQQKR